MGRALLSIIASAVIAMILLYRIAIAVSYCYVGGNTSKQRMIWAPTTLLVLPGYGEMHVSGSRGRSLGNVGDGDRLGGV